MVLRPTKFVALAVLLTAACATPESDRGEAASPPYALAAGVPVPHRFAEGVVSTEAPEFATAFSPDGQTVYFNRASADRSVLQILASTYRGGAWTPPEALPFSDGTYRDVDPFVSPDGQRLYFSSARPVDGDASEDFDTWYVERTPTGWGAPVNPGPPLNGPGSQVFVSVARSGAVYFSGEGPGGTRGLFRSAWRDGAFQQPERLVFDVDAGVGLGNPCVAPDESYLIIASADLGGEGGADLFISYRRVDGTWSAPENLGPRVNSSYSDFAPHLSLDGGYLFYTSERPGVVAEGAVDGRPPGDIYQIPWPLP